MQENAKQNFKTGDKVEVAIEGVAFGGQGVARVRNMVLFVPFAVDGDVAEIRITEVRKTYLRGKLERIVNPSPWRVKPECPYYFHCGGCQYQHMIYDHQLELKRNQVIESFRRIGKFPSPPVEDIVPSPKTYGYRGKAELHLLSRRGRLQAVGFMDVSGSKVVDIERCEIVDETINDELRRFRQEGFEGGPPVEVTGTRVIWSQPPLLSPPPFEGEGSGKFLEENASWIKRIVKGRAFQVHPQGFFQANLSLVDRLVDAVIEMCALTGRETVIDCYSGAGLFSLFLADRAGQVIAVEIEGDAVRAAKSNFSRFGHSGALVYEGDIEKVLQDLLEEKKDVDVVVLDPPRTGCDRGVLTLLAEWRPKRLVYISCDPATQARDIRTLADRGFSLKVLQPFDMFPQTKHIEVIALLTGY